MSNLVRNLRASNPGSFTSTSYANPSRTGILVALGLMVSGCVAGADGDEGSFDDPGGKADSANSQTIRIVEVLANSVAGPATAFIELRNDAEREISLSKYKLRFGNSSTTLSPRPVPGAVPTSDASVVLPHELALVVDSRLPDADLARMACETPIAPAAIARATGNLASTLRLQERVHCIPVFTITGGALGDRLAQAMTISLVEGTKRRDTAEASWSSASLGVSFERTGFDSTAFEPSPIGSTPGTRNFVGSDPAFMVNPGGRPPIQVLSSSPWRVGDMLMELRRRTDDAQAAAEIAAIEAGTLPHNPLVKSFAKLVNEAGRKVQGSFYQINDPEVIDSLVRAEGRGAEVQLTTDAEFRADAHYVEGFATLEQAGVELVFDADPSGANRAPLSHNKFSIFDEAWVWTGSFNPIEDEPARIHADNALILRSPALASIHKQEFETLFSGQFGVLKRDEGVGGGEVWIDGAQVEVRFSPGLSADQLSRRGAALASGQNACLATVPSSGAYVIEDRYRSLDPCGGPLDLIVGEVARAQSSVYFVAFSLALNELAEVIIGRMQDGDVEVKGVVDPTVVSRGAPSKILGAGADVRFTPNSDPECPSYVTPRRLCPANPNKVWLHHKFVLIDYGTDHPVVITGSHNLSESAERQNDETLVVIRDRAVAEQFYRIFREVFDHPQTMGERRDMADLPALAITEVRSSAEPSGPQFVEITNLGDEPASLAGLELWNRHSAVAFSGSNLRIQPDERAVLVVGNGAAIDVPSGTLVIETAADVDRPFIGPGTPLVLRSSDKRWIATYDPYTSSLEGFEPAEAGAAAEWLDFDRVALSALTRELLGVNTTPDASRPTWSPRGLFSDWVDEHDVSPAGLVLMQSARARFTPSAQPEGTPGT